VGLGGYNPSTAGRHGCKDCRVPEQPPAASSSAAAKPEVVTRAKNTPDKANQKSIEFSPENKCAIVVVTVKLKLDNGDHTTKSVRELKNACVFERETESSKTVVVPLVE
jgi:hypothetical protein